MTKYHAKNQLDSSKLSSYTIVKMATLTTTTVNNTRPSQTKTGYRLSNLKRMNVFVINFLQFAESIPGPAGQRWVLKRFVTHLSIISVYHGCRILHRFPSFWHIRKSRPTNGMIVGHTLI